MAVPGVRMVQSASRPDGKVPDQAMLSYQVGVLGHQLGETVDSLTQRLGRVAALDQALAQTQSAVDNLGSGLRGGPRLTVLPASEAASPQLPARIVDLLKPGA